MNDAQSIVTCAEEDPGLLRVTLRRPKGNVIDRQMTGALRSVVEGVCGRPDLRTLLFEGEGEHFSFGASVEEHLPDEVAAMLPEFHVLFRELFQSGKVLLAAVRGMCLGGGLELASFCHRVFAAPDATLGNPEIKLGVFAPIASVVLPLRCGQSVADELLLTGRTLSAPEALDWRLVDVIAEDPVSAARAWHVKYIAPLSGAALPFAVRAGRHRLGQDLTVALEQLEHSYLHDLMKTTDAVEGVQSFLAKRKPQWKHQ